MCFWGSCTKMYNPCNCNDWQMKQLTIKMVTTFPMNIDFLEEKLQYNYSAIHSVWNDMIDRINWILLMELVLIHNEIKWHNFFWQVIERLLKA